MKLGVGLQIGLAVFVIIAAASALVMLFSSGRPFGAGCDEESLSRIAMDNFWPIPQVGWLDHSDADIAAADAWIKAREAWVSAISDPCMRRAYQGWLDYVARKREEAIKEAEKQRRIESLRDSVPKPVLK